MSTTSRFHDLHHLDEPLVLPNAWDHASAMLFAQAGFPAVGTTSLGVAAARCRILRAMRRKSRR